MSYQTRVTRITITPQGEPMFSELATHIEVADEAAGEFIKITQLNAHGKDGQCVAINPGSEWAGVRAAVDRLMAEIKEANDE